MLADFEAKGKKKGMCFFQQTTACLDLPNEKLARSLLQIQFLQANKQIQLMLTSERHEEPFCHRLEKTQQR